MVLCGRGQKQKPNGKRKKGLYKCQPDPQWPVTVTRIIVAMDISSVLISKFCMYLYEFPIFLFLFYIDTLMAVNFRIWALNTKIS